MVEKSYNKTVIYFNFGRHKPCGLGEYHVFGLINPYVYLIEVNNFLKFHCCKNGNFQMKKKLYLSYFFLKK